MHMVTALDLMQKRVMTRRAFKSQLSEKGTIIQDIAQSRIDIDQARLLVLQAAALIDTQVCYMSVRACRDRWVTG